MDVKKVLLLIIVSFILVNCRRESDKILRLDDLTHESLSYNDLPKNIGLIYKEAAALEYSSSRDTLINFMNDYQIGLYKVTFTESHLKVLFNGYNHNFVINDSYVLKLKANQGDPFIFDNNSFYYTEELYLRDTNYKKSKYIRIDLSEFFESLE